MSRRLTPVTRAELISRFRQRGWQGPRTGGKHAYMAKGRHKVRIPNPHHRGEIGPGLLATILDQAGITRDEWLAGED